MRPIDADDVLAKLRRMVNHCETNGMGRELAILFRVFDAVMDSPTVRCKDCEQMKAKGLEFYFCDCDNVFECSEALSNAPTLTLDDLLPNGRWIETVQGGNYNERTDLTCPVCGKDFENVPWPDEWHYCPSCGAKMDESEDQIER